MASATATAVAAGLGGDPHRLAALEYRPQTRRARRPRRCAARTSSTSTCNKSLNSRSLKPAFSSASAIARSRIGARGRRHRAARTAPCDRQSRWPQNRFRSRPASAAAEPRQSWPRRTQIGHAAVFEVKPGLGHVFVPAEQGHAHGCDTCAPASAASDSTRSMSWIIRSSTTPMSVERNGERAGAHRFDVLRRSQMRPRPR